MWGLTHRQNPTPVTEPRGASTPTLGLALPELSRVLTCGSPVVLVSGETSSLRQRVLIPHTLLKGVRPSIQNLLRGDRRRHRHLLAQQACCGVSLGTYGHIHKSTEALTVLKMSLSSPSVLGIRS